MTGIVTDIGQVIGAYLRTHSQAQAEVWKLKILCPLLLGFIVGGFLGSTLPSMLNFKYVSFPSFMLCLTMGICYLSYRAVVAIMQCRTKNLAYSAAIKSRSRLLASAQFPREDLEPSDSVAQDPSHLP